VVVFPNNWSGVRVIVFGVTSKWSPLPASLLRVKLGVRSVSNAELARGPNPYPPPSLSRCSIGLVTGRLKVKVKVPFPLLPKSKKGASAPRSTIEFDEYVLGMLHPISPVLKLTDAPFCNPETDVVIFRSHMLEVHVVPLPVQVSVRLWEETMIGQDIREKEIIQLR
jgi:hypothetical protein